MCLFSFNFLLGEFEDLKCMKLSQFKLTITHFGSSGQLTNLLASVRAIQGTQIVGSAVRKFTLHLRRGDKLPKPSRGRNR